MTMLKIRFQTLLALAVLALGLLITAIAGLFVYTAATATPLHPNPDEAPSVTHAEPAPGWTAAVARGRDVVRAGLSAQNLPGLSVAVGVEGQIVWAEGFGWSDLTYRTPVSPDTRFRIGTASMALTSAAVGRLLEEGRLQLDEPIQNYVPEFPAQPWPVTLRQVMGHVAGIRNDGGDEGPFGVACERPVDGLQLFADRPLLFEPGTRYRFSTFGWILVSAAVEAAGGEPFLRFVRRQVLDPAGMADTEADAAGELLRDRASFYFPRFAADPRYGLHPTRPLDLSCYAGAYVFLSTPSDLVRFGLAIVTGRLLKPATVALLQTPQRLVTGEETGYGLGWDLETVTLGGQPAPWVGHDGTTMGGMVASLVTFPERGLVIAVMSNIAYADTESLAVGIAEAFSERPDRPARD